MGVRQFLLLPVAATLLGAGVSPAPALGQARSIIIESFHSDIEVRPDAGIVVTETIRPRFTGQWNGLRRVLSLRPPEDYGARYRLDVSILSAADDAGRPLRYDVERAGRNGLRVSVWVPDAADRTATVVLTYAVQRALGFYEAHPDGDWDEMDELYWNVTGTEWEVPIRQASARVRLPGGARPVQAAAYAGPAGSTRHADIRILDAGVEVPAVGPLEPGHGLTVGVGWPPGHVERPATPPASRAAAPRWIALLALLLPAGVFTLARRTWDRKGRDPARRAVTVQWEPPQDLSAVQVGTLVDHRVEMHDILSILVDLAVRGYLVIEERERSRLIGTATEYCFHLMRPEPEWGELAPYEKRFLRGLFSGAGRAGVAATSGRGGFLGTLASALSPEPAAAGAPDGAVDSVRLADLQNRFYKEIPRIRDEVYAELVRRGLYRERPDKVRGRWAAYTALALLLGAGAAIGSVALWEDAVIAIAFMAGGLATTLILGVFAWIMPARTPEGARTMEAALGFRRFLERVETPRYKRMITSPAQFERFLPYAMAFRCEEKWARAFDDLLREPPDWYRGATVHAAFQPSRFAGSLGDLSSATMSTLSSSPSSSGSGGGGSVGGGGGGGVGGGF